jgi:hypothetical protein
MICPTGEGKYFCKKDWTTQISLRSHDNSPRMRNGLGWLMWPIRSDTLPTERLTTHSRPPAPVPVRCDTPPS